MRFTPNLIRRPTSGLVSFVKIPGADARPIEVSETGIAPVFMKTFKHLICYADWDC